MIDERETNGVPTSDSSVAHEAVTPEEELDAAPDTEPADSVPAAQAEADRYLNNWKRAEADLINYRRRAEQEREDAVKYGNINLLKALLPIFDDFDRAIDSAPEQVAGSAWFEGLQLLRRKITSTLQAQGVEEIAAEGETFDPNVHEAVLYEEGDEGKVTATFQKGYRLHGRVVRPSLVRVGSGHPTAPAETA
ncbi:MAG TPA: nucleotide exchange factor GrpE [Dehalococcoidia bacterium]|nr:nucleotide exchange factor GrpE [Dehalococcoidia bacterium]